MKCSLAPNPRHWFAQAATLAAGLALAAPSIAPAFNMCKDFGGTPMPLDSETLEFSGLPGLTLTTFALPEGGFYYDETIEGAGGTTVTDLDVFIKLNHPRVEDLVIWLTHTIPTPDPDAPDDVVHVGLMATPGCEDFDWDSNTIFNQDMAVYLDDEAGAFIGNACDRSIPSVEGRFSPPDRGTVLFFNSTDVIGESGLASFTGRQIFDGGWTLSIVDLSANSVGESASLVEWCLAFNTIESGDTAPREETATIASSQSGNGVVTISDHIGSALFLLNYLELDDRLVERRATDLSNYSDNELFPQSPIALDPTWREQFIHDSLFENLRRGSGTEFLRLDAAPAASNGDGRFTVADWVQVTRYASGRGFDEPVPAGGPISPSDRIVRAGDTIIPRDQIVKVPIVMRSKGVEHEVGFGLQFDPTLLEYVGVEKGPCLPTNANFQLNNVENANTEGLLGLQVGLLPDQVYSYLDPDNCGVRQPPAVLTGAAGPISNVTLSSSDTRPASLLYQVSTELVSVDFTDDEPIVTVNINMNSPIADPLNDYQLDIAYDSTRLVYLSATQNATFSGSPVIASEPFSSNDDGIGYNRVTLYGESAGGSFVEGQLLTLQFRVIAGTAVDQFGAPVFNDDGLQLVSSNDPVVLAKKGNTTVFNANLVGSRSPFTRTTFNNTETSPIESTPILSLVDAAGLNTSGSFCGAGQRFYLDVEVSNNLIPVTDIAARIAIVGTGVGLVDVVLPNGSLGFPNELEGFDGDPIVTIPDNFSATGQVNAQDIETELLNGKIVRLVLQNIGGGNTEDAFVRVGAVAAGDSIIFSNSKKLYAQPIPAEYQLDCGAGKTVSEFAAVAAETSADETTTVDTVKGVVTSGPIVSTDFQSIRREAGEVFLDVAVNVTNNATDITAYNLLLTYDSVVFELAELAKGDYAPGDTLTIPSSTDRERANYSSVTIQDDVTAAGFQNGELFRASFRVLDTDALPSSPPSVFVTTIPPVSDEVKLADVLFRARPGAGSTSTDISFVSDPQFFIAPSVRGPGGVPMYAHFADAGVTIIDNADVRPTVRINDKVLCPENLQTVQVVLESNGIENAVGFEVNFDSERLILVGIDRGGDIPAEGFFYTEPNEEEVFPILNGNETREEALAKIADQGFTLEQFEGFNKVSILTSLQPGDSFAASTASSDARIIANLRFLSKGATSAESEVFFTELFPNSSLLEEAGATGPLLNSPTKGQVVSPAGIALVADFPNGTITIPAESCTYTVVNVSPADALFGPDGGDGILSIQTGEDCPFTSTSTVPWIRIIDGQNGFGPGEVEYLVLANDSGDSRSAFIEIGCESFQVTQSGCAFELSPTTLGYSQFGGESSFNVITSDACSWRLESSATWVTFGSADAGVGPASVAIRVGENPGAPRNATVNLIDADNNISATLTITQGVCTYALDPTQAPSVFPPRGGEGSFSVITQEFCPWQAVASVPWIEVVDSRGDGVDNTVTYRVLPNSDFPTSFDASGNPVPRVGTIVVERNFIYTVRQGFPDCSYRTAPEEIVADFEEQVVEFRLITSDPACPFTIQQPAVDWVSFIGLNADGATSGVGTTAFNIMLEENTTDQDRTVTISITRGAEVVGSFKITQFQKDNRFAFDFLDGNDDESEGWTPFSPSVFTPPTFDYQEEGEVGRGRLCLTSTENQNTFGWWESPLLSLTSEAEADDLFEARFLVSSDAANSANTPVFRMRVTTADFQQSNVDTVSSVGQGVHSPSKDNFKEYTTYFTVPGAEYFTNQGQAVRAYFEILNVDAFDVANQSVCLERLVIMPFDRNNLGVQVSERRYVLAQSGIQQFFQQVTVPGVFTAPVFGSSERGLTITSNFNGITAPPETIGFLTVDTGVEIENNRVYQLTFQIGANVSNALEVRKSLVPTFRVRVNDSSYASSSLVNIESIDDNSRVPTLTANQRYEVWYRGTEALAGKSLLASFDYLLNPASFSSENEFRDAADIVLVLEAIEINSYDLAPETP